MKKKICVMILIIISALCLAFGLTACSDNPSDNGGDKQESSESKVYYVGMNIPETSATTPRGESTMLALKSSSLFARSVEEESYGGYSINDFKNDMNELMYPHDTLNFDQSDTIGKMICSEREERTFTSEYATKGLRDCTLYQLPLTIELYNPEQFEILSFYINGKKYQIASGTASVLFEEDVTYINMQLDEKGDGIKSYTVSDIKYIDGTQIKGGREATVKMDAYEYASDTISLEIVKTSAEMVETYDDLTHPVCDVKSGSFGYSNEIATFAKFGIINAVGKNLTSITADDSRKDEIIAGNGFTHISKYYKASINEQIYESTENPDNGDKKLENNAIKFKFKLGRQGSYQTAIEHNAIGENQVYGYLWPYDPEIHGIQDSTLEVFADKRPQLLFVAMSATGKKKGVIAHQLVDVKDSKSAGLNTTYDISLEGDYTDCGVIDISYYFLFDDVVSCRRWTGSGEIEELKYATCFLKADINYIEMPETEYDKDTETTIQPTMSPKKNGVQFAPHDFFVIPGSKLFEPIDIEGNFCHFNYSSRDGAVKSEPDCDIELSGDNYTLWDGNFIRLKDTGIFIVVDGNILWYYNSEEEYQELNAYSRNYPNSFYYKGDTISETDLIKINELLN